MALAWCEWATSQSAPIGAKACRQVRDDCLYDARANVTDQTNTAENALRARIARLSEQIQARRMAYVGTLAERLYIGFF